MTAPVPPGVLPGVPADVDQDSAALAELRRWLAAVDALAEAVASAHSLRTVLDLVADTGRRLLGFDFCAVLLPDPGRDALVITGWSGLSREYVDQVNADHPVRITADPQREQAPSSRAFQSGAPVAVADIAAEPQFQPWGGVAREQGYRAMVSVPLVAAGTVLGTLNGYDRAVRRPSPHDLERLTLLANHAALALTSARMVDQLQEMNEALTAQADLLTRSERIHQQLLSVAVEGGGVSGIADALAGLLRRGVLIDDVSGAVLASGGAGADALSAAVGALPRSVARTVSAWSATRIADGSRAYLVWPVPVGGEPAARLWLEDSGALEPIDQRAVEHAVIVLSVELVRLRTAVEVELRLSGDLLADVLGGAAVDGSDVRERARRLGHELDGPSAVMVAQVTADEPSRQAVVEQRSLAALAGVLGRERPRPLLGRFAGRVVALLPLPDGARVESARRVLAAAPGVRAVSAAWCVGGPGDLPRAHRVARGVLALAAGAGRTDTTVSGDDLGVVGLLVQLEDPAPLLAFADRTLGPLRRSDTDRGTQLVRTLTVHLAHRQQRAATAAALHLHPNTVTQRLQRIQVLTGLDLADPAAVLQAQTAVTVLQVAEQGAR